MHKKNYRNTADIVGQLLKVIEDSNIPGNHKANKIRIMDITMLSDIEFEAYLTVLMQNQLLETYLDRSQEIIYRLTKKGRNFLAAYQDITGHVSLLPK
jgi:predicted transcriptional regulator